jgi:hypothetical protein
MSRALLFALLLSACGTTELQRKEIAIQTALDGAFLACQTALNDPRMTWDEGARAYCLRVVNKSGCVP